MLTGNTKVVTVILASFGAVSVGNLVGSWDATALLKEALVAVFDARSRLHSTSSNRSSASADEALLRAVDSHMSAAVAALDNAASRAAALSQRPTVVMTGDGRSGSWGAGTVALCFCGVGAGGYLAVGAWQGKYVTRAAFGTAVKQVTEGLTGVAGKVEVLKAKMGESFSALTKRVEYGIEVTEDLSDNVSAENEGAGAWRGGGAWRRVAACTRASLGPGPRHPSSWPLTTCAVASGRRAPR